MKKGWTLDKPIDWMAILLNLVKDYYDFIELQMRLSVEQVNMSALG